MPIALEMPPKSGGNLQSNGVSYSVRCPLPFFGGFASLSGRVDTCTVLCYSVFQTAVRKITLQIGENRSTIGLPFTKR